MKRFNGWISLAVLTLALSARAATISVTNTNDSGPGSLRQAILDSNASTGIVDTITFSIPGAGLHTISPANGLPSITDPVIIDGYTQPGSSPNTLTNGDNAVLLIELNGRDAGAASGLVISHGFTIVRGLVVDGFQTPCCAGYGYGITLSGNSNVIAGNFIGVNPAGTAVTAANGDTGVLIGSGFGDIIGGPTPAARNIVSGNRVFGVDMCCSPSSGGHVIQGNYIGTDASGTIALGNGASGVRLANSANNRVGGFTATERNLISGNTGDGVEIAQPPANGNTVQGNFIGTQIDGITALGNGGNGISFFNATTNNLVGGPAAGEGNVIAFNRGGGIVVGGGPTSFGLDTDNAFLGNAIYSNTGLGIDLLETNAGNLTVAGVTINDPCDLDDGENRLQNYPVLTLVTNTTAGVQIQGRLDSTPNTTFRLEFFANSACDPSGHGQGELFIGFTNITTGADCTNNFSVTFARLLSTGLVVTATATDPDGNTSEFSACHPVTAGPVVTHNFAIVSLVAPANVNLSAATPALTKRVVVQIQNLGTHAETITSAALSRGLVTVDLTNLHSGCRPPSAGLINGPPNLVKPRSLKPNQKLSVFFNVTFTTNCVPDSAKGPGHEDFSYRATVSAAALDANADTVSQNDTCPRPPNPSIGDKGCGGKNPNTKQLGAPVQTDVFLK